MHTYCTCVLHNQLNHSLLILQIHIVDIDPNLKHVTLDHVHIGEYI